MSGKHVFRRNSADLYRASQVGQFAVRRSHTSSTLRISEFPKGFEGFWGTLNQLRQELSTAVCGNRGVAVFLRFFNGWRLIFTLAKPSRVQLMDRGCAGNLNFSKDF